MLGTGRGCPAQPAAAGKAGYKGKSSAPCSSDGSGSGDVSIATVRRARRAQAKATLEAKLAAAYKKIRELELQQASEQGANSAREIAARLHLDQDLRLRLIDVGRGLGAQQMLQQCNGTPSHNLGTAIALARTHDKVSKPTAAALRTIAHARNSAAHQPFQLEQAGICSAESWSGCFAPSANVGVQTETAVEHSDKAVQAASVCSDAAAQSSMDFNDHSLVEIPISDPVHMIHVGWDLLAMARLAAHKKSIDQVTAMLAGEVRHVGGGAMSIEVGRAAIPATTTSGSLVAEEKQAEQYVDGGKTLAGASGADPTSSGNRAKWTLVGNLWHDTGLQKATHNSDAGDSTGPDLVYEDDDSAGTLPELHSHDHGNPLQQQQQQLPTAEVLQLAPDDQPQYAIPELHPHDHGNHLKQQQQQLPTVIHVASDEQPQTQIPELHSHDHGNHLKQQQQQLPTAMHLASDGRPQTQIPEPHSHDHGNHLKQQQQQLPTVIHVASDDQPQTHKTELLLRDHGTHQQQQQQQLPTAEVSQAASDDLPQTQIPEPHLHAHGNHLKQQQQQLPPSDVIQVASDDQPQKQEPEQHLQDHGNPLQLYVGKTDVEVDVMVDSIGDARLYKGADGQPHSSCIAVDHSSSSSNLPFTSSKPGKGRGQSGSLQPTHVEQPVIQQAFQPPITAQLLQFMGAMLSQGHSWETDIGPFRMNLLLRSCWNAWALFTFNPRFERSRSKLRIRPQPIRAARKHEFDAMPNS